MYTTYDGPREGRPRAWEKDAVDPRRTALQLHSNDTVRQGVVQRREAQRVAPGMARQVEATGTYQRDKTPMT